MNLKEMATGKKFSKSKYVPKLTSTLGHLRGQVARLPKFLKKMAK